MRTSFIYTVVFFLILVFVSCGNKEDPESYEVRKREHRLFRCKVDGKEWTYTGKEYWGLIPHIRSAYYEEDSSLYIHAYYIPGVERTEQEIILYSVNGLKLGKNLLDWRHPRHTKTRGFYCRGCARDISFSQNNYIDILDIDTLNHIIVGRFECKTEAKYEIENAIITDGEFDLKINAWVK